MYGEFARIYDIFMDDVDYQAWAEYYLELMRLSGVKVKTLLDAACGTGSMTVEFARRGIRAMGLDASPEMLDIARQKSRKCALDILFVKQDMKEIRLNKKVDAIVCVCDGVNYLLTDDHVSAFFSAAYNNLNPRGGLFFDISSEYKLKEIIGDNFFCEDRGSSAYIWNNQYDKSSGLLEMDISFFVENNAGLYQRIDEFQRQRAHSESDLQALLKHAGFDEISTYGDKNFNNPKKDEMRIHFAAVKA